MLSRTRCRCLLTITAAVVGLMWAGTTPARADNPAMSFGTGSIGFADFFQTLGWKFTTNSPITVDGLGYYDFGGDGLAVPHEVGIFYNAGNPLASTIIAPGCPYPLFGTF